MNEVYNPREYNALFCLDCDNSWYIPSEASYEYALNYGIDLDICSKCQSKNLDFGFLEDIR